MPYAVFSLPPGAAKTPCRQRLVRTCRAAPAKKGSKHIAPTKGWHGACGGYRRLRPAPKRERRVSSLSKIPLGFLTATTRALPLDPAAFEKAGETFDAPAADLLRSI
ncbi:MAG: hypothetical protein HFG20_06345 [Anaerotruncus sp.]|nr:hypothetical protein [Anaerotruncus sp.]